MDKLDKKAYKVFKSALYPKFLATVDERGVPNVVPVLTLKCADENTLIFARMMVWKTARNLESTRKATAVCIGPGMSVWSVKGDFVEFAKRGDYIEEYQKSFLFRYNAYAGAEQVGVIRIREVMPTYPVQWAKTLYAQRTLSKIAQFSFPEDGKGVMPLQVINQFKRKGALKYIAQAGEDGYPLASPALAMFPIGRDKLIVSTHHCVNLRDSGTVATCVITPDIIAYQVKGRWGDNFKSAGVEYREILVEEAYTASPPLPGKKIEK